MPTIQEMIDQQLLRIETKLDLVLRIKRREVAAAATLDGPGGDEARELLAEIDEVLGQ